MFDARRELLDLYSEAKLANDLEKRIKVIALMDKIGMLGSSVKQPSEETAPDERALRALSEVNKGKKR